MVQATGWLNLKLIVINLPNKLKWDSLAGLSILAYQSNISGRLLALPSNNIIGWKGLPVTNTLAY
jgi:hypothetical protein